MVEQIVAEESVLPVEQSQVEFAAERAEVYGDRAQIHTLWNEPWDWLPAPA